MILPSFDVRRSAVAAALLIVLFNGAGAAPTHAQQGTPFGTLIDVAHSPGPTQDDVALALTQVANISGHGSYMHEWATGDTGLELAGVLATQFRARGLKVFLQFAPVTLGQVRPPEGMAPSFWDPVTWERYLLDATRLASLKPDYLNLCPEVDLIFQLSPDEALAYAALYKQAYALVKQLSPETQVGVSYHMDLFFGRSEAWIPGFLGPSDYVAFTSYPGWLVHYGLVDRAVDFPSSYYDRIRILFPTIPVIFSEVGWPSGGPGTPLEQAEFLSALPRAMQGVRPVMITWVMLRDTRRFQVKLLTDEEKAIFDSLYVDPASLFEEFNSMGLVDWDGNFKPAYVAAAGMMF